MSEEGKAQRWQKIAIDQLGYSLNLTLTYTVAALAYWFTLLKSSDFNPACSARLFMLCSLPALGLSAICGFTCVVNRMIDFRGTAKRARGDQDAPTKEYLQGFGLRSWVLFYIHLAGFVTGVALISVALLLTYGAKLR
jgi:hypothetical protein